MQMKADVTQASRRGTQEGRRGKGERRGKRKDSTTLQSTTKEAKRKGEEAGSRKH